MRTSIQDLRERRAAKAAEARKLLDDHVGDKWNSSISDQVDTLYAEIEDVDAQMKRIEKQLEIEAENHFERANPREINPDSPKALFNKWVRQGDEGISADEWRTIRATMSTTTGSEGGYTVPSEISATIYDAMKAFGAMRHLAEVIRTQDGRPLSFPTSDGTAEVGEWIAQNVTATAADPTFGTASLNVFKASSKIIAVPYELLQDATIDMEAFVNKRVAQRLGRIGNVGFTTGTGTTQPDGVVPKASSGKVGTTGQTLTIIYDDIIDLIHAVDPAYRGSKSSFMTNDSLLKVLRKIKDTAGRPIWTPSYDSGMRFGINNVGSGVSGHGGYSSQDTPVVFDYLAGYPVFVNNDIAVPAANAKSMVFGDLTYYKIRDAMDVQLFRFTDSAYTKLGQVAFLAWARMGGNLVDTAAVKFYQHSAT
jgi:HK97 family phage major capsid protein